LIRRLALALCVVWSLSAVAQTTLNGAGATFPYPMYSKWFSEYHKLHPDIQFNYQSIGSGGGVRQVIAGTVDFGASDGPMTDQQLAEAQKARGTKILHIPTVLGAVVPAYNIPGVSAELKFTPEALAGIFLGKITQWNDKAIQKLNFPISQLWYFIGLMAAEQLSSSPTTSRRLAANGRARSGKGPPSNGPSAWEEKETKAWREWCARCKAASAMLN